MINRDNRSLGASSGLELTQCAWAATKKKDCHFRNNITDASIRHFFPTPKREGPADPTQLTQVESVLVATGMFVSKAEPFV